MRIDAHQHFWRRNRGDYDWLTADLTALWHDFLPNDLSPVLSHHGIGGTILVQAAASEAETAYMLSLAHEHDFIRGVVGWTDLAAPDAPERIAALSADPLLVGLRPMLQNLPDDNAIVLPQVQPALAAMAHHGLALDALIQPCHLPHMRTLRALHPALGIVIDHAAKPDIRGGDLDAWGRDIAAVAADGRTYCKLSGLITEAGPGWQICDLRPVVAVVIEAFGPERVMWGSDWPVLNLAGDYDGWLAATRDLLAHLTAEDQADIMGKTAQRFYRLKER